MSRLKQLARYISNVFHVPHLVKGVTDFRDKARIQRQTSSVLLAWIIGFCARIQSREELGRLLDRRAVQKLVGCHISSDTLGRVLGQIHSDSLRTSLLVPIVREIRRNKAWKGGTIHTQLLVGIDGSESFCTRSQPCPQCLSRHVEVRMHAQLSRVTEHYHAAVWAFIIGTHPRIYLDVEPIQPGEGEVTAAKRLVTRLVKHYGRWIDGFVADANFASAPFLNHIRSLGRHYIVRVKDEQRRHLTRDAAGLFSQRPADRIWIERVGHHDLQVSAWDEEGLTSWECLQEPARVVACDELELPHSPSRRRKLAHPETQRPRSFLATSYPKQIFPTHAVWLAYHRRWDIENNAFRQLKHEWHWDHPFVHTPAALLNLWLLMAVAANLFMAFVDRRLRSGRANRIPSRAIAQEIAAALRLFSCDEMPCFDTG